eukprot:CAMPEP_0183821892 /NCGR_PEP_ID=MMETSP0803_2-20130417/65371_1 /TAXON_ID=195967 /ORGANISM="Crustomastix stigmata, Strain CCMP3273" /LENGTH=68 /DNA_ID=CAMNT_0026066785 /DNA_START=500 /DNA_END=706 /DNA_ORIENTATION=+
MTGGSRSGVGTYALGVPEAVVSTGTIKPLIEGGKQSGLPSSTSAHAGGSMWIQSVAGGVHGLTTLTVR